MAKPTKQDLGAAMMAWYAEALQDHREGLVSQAQAAAMLGISRMAVNRLVARGYLRVVYFPKPPDIAGFAATEESPAYVRLAERLGIAFGDRPKYDFPKACFVSFADVVKLWHSGDVQKHCEIDWSGIFDPLFYGPKKVQKRRNERAQERASKADQWRKELDSKGE